jgi:hypothetical protein
MRETAEHSEAERRFYVRHGHWPEQAKVVFDRADII